MTSWTATISGCGFSLDETLYVGAETALMTVSRSMVGTKRAAKDNAEVVMSNPYYAATSRKAPGAARWIHSERSEGGGYAAGL